MPRYTELGPIASAMGVADDLRGQFEVTRDGFRITVSLRIDSGVVRGVDIRVKNPGWPEVELRRETNADRAAKHGGMNVEVQTGDKAFDDFVYIESPYPQAVLAPLLQSPPLRRAIGDLVAQYTKIEITKSALTVDTRSAGTDLLAPARFLPLVESVLTVAKLFPPVPAGARKQSERGGGLIIAAVANGFLSASVLPMVTAHVAEPESGWLRAIGLGIGLVVALGTIPLVRAWTKGHSRSSTYWAITIVLDLFGLPLFFMSAIVLANALLDFSPPENLAGKVTQASPFLDDGEARAWVDVAWSAHAPGTPATAHLNVKDPRPVGVRVGDDVRAIRRQGGLGFAWWQLAPEIKR